MSRFDVDFAEAWKLRFGSEPGFEAPDLGAFLGHRSVRDYADVPIAEETVRSLVAAAQSAANSSNLQLWTVVSVQEPERRERMAQLCGNQSQVRTAPWFFAFLADHHRIRKAAQRVGESGSGLDYAEFFIMAVVDAALAAERMVCAAESLGIGICYIGGLRNDAAGVAELLDLPAGVFGVFGLCLGYPAEPMTAEIKPRLGPETVWHRETYDRSADVAEYDERMRAFYVSQRMKGEVTWSMRSGRRVGDGQLSGREALRPWLEARGFNLR